MEHRNTDKEVSDDIKKCDEMLERIARLRIHCQNAKQKAQALLDELEKSEELLKPKQERP